MKSEPLPPLIAHVIFALGTGGLENGLINLINHMPVNRYRHAIICLTEAHGFEDRIQRPDVEIMCMHKKRGHDFPVYLRVWKALRALKPQIVHTRNFVALESQIPAFFTPDTKRVHGEHGRDMQDLHGLNQKQKTVRRIIQPLVNEYITVSQDLESWLINDVKLPARKIQRIYNGVDAELFYPRNSLQTDLAPPGFIPENGLLIGTVGRLAEVKNQLLLIDGFAHLLSLCPALKRRIRLLIVGDGPMRDKIHARVDEAGIKDMVWLAGDRDDVPELMRLLDIFVLPSLAEGISNTILEAMATGLPIVATRVGGNPELVKEGVNGRLIDAKDFKSLGNALSKMIDDSEATATMARASLRRIQEEFSWNKMVNNYLSVYDKLLGSQ